MKKVKMGISHGIPIFTFFMLSCQQFRNGVEQFHQIKRFG